MTLKIYSDPRCKTCTTKEHCLTPGDPGPNCFPPKIDLVQDRGLGTQIRDSKIDPSTKVWHYCNIYRSTIGANCKIASYVEIGGSTVGDGCKIEAFTFIPPGLTIGDSVFIGPHVCFTNDKHPTASDDEWELCETVVEDNVSIGAGSIILSGLTIGEGAMIGAGSIVVRDVKPHSLVYGSSARTRRTIH